MSDAEAKELNKSEADTSREYSIDELLEWPSDDLAGLDIERLMVTSPAVIANFLGRLDVDDIRTTLRRITGEHLMLILAELDSQSSAEVIGEMNEERALAVLEDFDPDDAVDVISNLEEDDRLRLMNRMDPETVATVESLLHYDPETAGGIMTPEVAMVPAHFKVDQAIERIRDLNEEFEDLNYVYVVDDANRLLGVISMRDLILARSIQSVADVMNPKLKGMINVHMDREAVALLFAEHNLVSLPVVDDDDCLVGIVTADDVIDVIHEEATEDIQKLVGASGDESIHDKLTYSMRGRHPWLQVNLLTAFLASAVIYFFSDKIGVMPILAVVMPIVASMGGNAGAQTLSVAIRGLALGDVQDSDLGRLYMKETLLGVINGIGVGVICAVVIFIVAKFGFNENNESSKMLALVTFIAMILNMGVSGLSGAFIPFFLKKMNFDPAQSASIFLTTVTDVAGFFIFLSLASLFLL